VRHNARAVYQKYLGWYDANPAHLDPLPPVDAGRKFVEYMGGAEAVIRRARQDFEQGNYRWVVQVLDHVVFADPDNGEARALAADAMEQLGYMAESATWRNSYLFGALELRRGPARVPAAAPFTADTLRALTLDLFFDYLGVRLNGPRAEGKTITLNWRFTDVDARYVLRLENSALTHVSGREARHADATLTLTRAALEAVALRRLALPEAVQSGQVRVDGDAGKVVELLSLLDDFAPMFEIVEPRRAGTPEKPA